MEPSVVLATQAGPDKEAATRALSNELADKGFLLPDLDGACDQLGAHRQPALDDLRAGMLRGRDDAHLDAAL